MWAERPNSHNGSIVVSGPYTSSGNTQISVSGSQTSIENKQIAAMGKKYFRYTHNILDHRPVLK